MGPPSPQIAMSTVITSDSGATCNRCIDKSDKPIIRELLQDHVALLETLVVAGKTSSAAIKNACCRWQLDDVFHHLYNKSNPREPLSVTQQDPDNLAGWLQTEKASLDVLLKTVQTALDVSSGLTKQAMDYGEKALNVSILLGDKYRSVAGEGPPFDAQSDAQMFSGF